VHGRTGVHHVPVAVGHQPQHLVGDGLLTVEDEHAVVGEVQPRLGEHLREIGDGPVVAPLVGPLDGGDEACQHLGVVEAYRSLMERGRQHGRRHGGRP